jgi:hypothetical protein
MVAKKQSEPLSEFVVSDIRLETHGNPFGATAEELLAGTLDENGLIGADTRINGVSARELCSHYYRKRNHFKEATRIGDLLVKANVITSQQLAEALHNQMRGSAPLGEILVKLGMCTFEDIESGLERQRNIREDLERMEQAKSEWRNLWDRFKSFVTDGGS